MGVLFTNVFSMKEQIFAYISTLVLFVSVVTPAYAQNTAVVDVYTSNVEIGASSVVMVYPVQAKLFGIFPFALNAQAEVTSNGSVDVHYPWYAFLFSTDQAQIDTKLKAVGQAASAFETNTLNAKQQVTLLALLRAGLQSSFETSAATSVGTAVQ